MVWPLSSWARISPASLYPKLGYDPVKSFSPVVLIGSNPVVLIVNANSPYRTLQDVLTAAKARPKTISSASAGSGTAQHMTLELLAFRTGTQFIHVPYKGSGPAIQDVIGGQVDMMFDTTVVAGPHIQSGKVHAIAVSSAKRLEALPNVPTIAESGVPGFEVVSWQGIFVPAGVPKPTSTRLEDILEDPTIRAVLVLTPPNTHLDIVQRLASAGKHVLVEKPLDVTLGKAQQLVETCEQNGVKLAVMLQHRMREASLALAGLVRDGTMGQLLSASASIRGGAHKVITTKRGVVRWRATAAAC